MRRKGALEGVSVACAPRSYRSGLVLALLRDFISSSRHSHRRVDLDLGVQVRGWDAVAFRLGLLGFKRARDPVVVPLEKSQAAVVSAMKAN
jgi:hypothetical protein